MEDETVVETEVTEFTEANIQTEAIDTTIEPTDGEIEAARVVEQIEMNMPVYNISINRTTPSGTVLDYPVNKLHDMLLVVAKKMKRPVNFCVYEGFNDIEFGVDGRVINIYTVIIPPHNTYDGSPLTLDNEPIDNASTSQCRYAWDSDISIFMDSNQKIRVNKDGSGLIIAGVGSNNLVIILNCLSEDNQAAQEIFTWILKKAMPLFEFSDDGFSERTIKKFCELYSQMVRNRYDAVNNEIEKLTRESYNARYVINEYESKRPIIEKELNYLKKMININGINMFRKHAKSLLKLIESKRFLDITPTNTGIAAVTNPIEIKYDDYTFKMGRYKVNINYADYKDAILIKRYDEKPDFKGDYIHPHIYSNGTPCFGELGSTPYVLYSAYRIPELLELLHEFLCSYNSDSPVARIGEFDGDGNYDGEGSEDPCDDCSEYGTPYCIMRCDNNNGDNNIECCEYRSRFCYLDCEYRDDCDLIPCEDCSEGDDYCFDGCEFNEDWRWKNACRECANDAVRCREINAERDVVEGEEVDGEEQERCPYYERACEIGCNPS